MNFKINTPNGPVTIDSDNGPFYETINLCVNIENKHNTSLQTLIGFSHVLAKHEKFIISISYSTEINTGITYAIFIFKAWNITGDTNIDRELQVETMRNWFLDEPELKACGIGFISHRYV